MYNHDASPRISLLVTQIIRPTTINKPIVWPALCISGFKGRPIKASKKLNNKCPPSSTGIGNKFIRPKLIEITAKKNARLTKPPAAT